MEEDYRVKKIEFQEIMTHRQAMEKYRDKCFHFVITEEVDRGDKDLGYVIYTYDTKSEMHGIPREELADKVVARTLGVAAEPFIQIGV